MASAANGPRLDANLMVLLERTRDVYGYIPDHSLTELADELGIPVVEVYGAATFYRRLPLRREGKHVIKVCKSIPCYLKQNRPVIEAIEKELGIAPGQTSLDRLFSLELVNCIGACDIAPAMMIDDRVFGHLTHEAVTEILAAYR